MQRIIKLVFGTPLKGNCRRWIGFKTKVVSWRGSIVMRTRRLEQTALTTFAFAACLMFALAAYAAIAHAQGLTVPQQAEAPVSPTTPGTLPGTGAGPGTAVGTNPITGQPCLGGGSSAINGGLPGATTQDQPGAPGNNVTGLPPNNSVYGLNNQIPNTSSPGAC